jgi:hypothetical protein
LIRAHLALERELEEMKLGSDRPRSIMAVDGAIYLHYKDRCWEGLTRMYGREAAKRLMPETFLG